MPRRATTRGRRLLGALVCTALGPAIVVATSHTRAAARYPGSPASASEDTRPNIILFMTDDQNRKELRWMAKTKSWLGRHGVTFTRALSPAPLCCPARAMTLTGEYWQKNGVQFNLGPYGGF